jgi:hypothetical protein
MAARKTLLFPVYMQILVICTDTRGVDVHVDRDAYSDSSSATVYAWKSVKNSEVGPVLKYFAMKTWGVEV